MGLELFPPDEFSGSSVTALYKDGVIAKPESSETEWSPNPTINDKVALIRHNITQLHVNAIVCPTTHRLGGSSGADGAIHFAAGPELKSECNTLGTCRPGDAKMTNAYRLPCSKVIHTVGPKYHILATQGEQGIATAETILSSCYTRSLELAVQARLRSIAFCCIATGAYGYPGNLAAEVALRQVRRFLESPAGARLERVVFCTYSAGDEYFYRGAISKFFPPEVVEEPRTMTLPIRHNGKGAEVKVKVEGGDEAQSEIDPAKELDWDEISECEYKCNKLNSETTLCAMEP